MSLWSDSDGHEAMYYGLADGIYVGTDDVTGKIIIRNAGMRRRKNYLPCGLALAHTPSLARLYSLRDMMCTEWVGEGMRRKKTCRISSIT